MYKTKLVLTNKKNDIMYSIYDKNNKCGRYYMLENINAHERDKYLSFDEGTHTYTLNKSLQCEKPRALISVTSLCGKHFEQFDADAIISKMMSKPSWNDKNKYWGMTPQEIKKMWNLKGKEASAAGTQMHMQIEDFMNIPTKEETKIKTEIMTKEWQQFMEFMKDHKTLEPFRTEWRVFDEEYEIAGSIDMVFKNNDGTYSIYDWKRVEDLSADMAHFNKFALSPGMENIPDTKYWHYVFQLNVYARILVKNYDIIIRDLFLVAFHPSAKQYRKISVPFIHETCTLLFKERGKNASYKKHKKT